MKEPEDELKIMVRDQFLQNAGTNHSTVEDVVNKPSHYDQGGIEVIDAIEAWELDFRLANAVKYIARAGKKDTDKTKQDLEKALWYVKRFIDKEL